MEKTPDVLELLLDKEVQKEIAHVNPTFNRADLLGAILEAWGGQEAFAQDVFREFEKAPKGSTIRQNILKMVTMLISEESKNEQVSPVEEMSDEELNRAILSIAPGLVSLKNK